jgi:predicted SAM-dependent methyltransferase
MKRYLHLGCGQNILPAPFENCDIRDIKGVNHVGPIFPLEFEDNKYDLIYASHILEHFSRNECQDVLNDWVRVLKPGGVLRLSVPSYPNLKRIYEISKDIDDVLGPLMGGQTYEENVHYNAFDETNLLDYMKNAGLEAIHPWDFRRTIHSGYWDFSQATTSEIPISLNLEGRKKLLKVDKTNYLNNRLKDLLNELRKYSDKNSIQGSINEILNGEG